MIASMGPAARAAARVLAAATAGAKDAAILAAAGAIESHADELLAVNHEEAATATSLTPAALDRMTLHPARIVAIAEALRAVAAQEDPVGRVLAKWTRPNGLRFKRVSVPIGVVAIIHESRPNVTAEAAAIAIKAGNAAILRSGSECSRTSALLARLFREGLREAGLPADALQFVETTDRAAVGALLSGLDGAVDLIVPRGGRSLVKRVKDEARVAVLAHLDGLCHVYLDAGADPEKAVAVTLNSKMRRPGVCGAAETLLIDRAGLARLLPPVAAALREAGCELRGDPAVTAADPAILPASPEDFDTEYLAPILSIAAVDGVDGAITHIARHGSAHTDAIVTEDPAAAMRFLSCVDSAIVLHNASTQFADGGEFGFGAEIGIATGRLHARGPVGAAELTTYKTVVVGNGQVRP